LSKSIAKTEDLSRLDTTLSELQIGNRSDPTLWLQNWPDWSSKHAAIQAQHHARHWQASWTSG